MTAIPLPVSTEPSRHPPFFTRSRAPGTLLPILLLAACTSVPLPPWTPSHSVVDAPAGSEAPAPAAPPVIVQISPAPPPAPLLPSASAAPTDEPPPYSPAVAARFPAPTVVYNTPGLGAGRTSFTSQAEIRAWLREQAASASRSAGIKAAVLPIGNSQRGETLEALVLTRAGGTDPAALQAAGRPTVLLTGQQHGNEPAGSEALLVIARELAQGQLQPMLEHINVVIVPRANPDGAASDQRVTQGGLDMNRDHLLLNTPEAQALAKLARDYHPTVVVDAHEYTVVGRYLEKFGTIQKFDAMVQYATTANLPEFLTKAAEEWYRRPMLSALKDQGLTTEWYYTTSTDLADKKVSMGGAQPDTGRNVNGLKNTVSLLIETRGVGIGRLHIQRRVHTHVTAITSVLASTAQRAGELSQLRPYIDKEVSAQACKGEAIVEAAPTAAQHDLVMLDPVSGADKTITVDWNSALALRSVKSRARPCGYLLSAASTTAVDRLRLQGVQVMRVAEPGSLLGDSYRETARTSGERQDVRGTIAGSSPIIKVQVSLTRGVVDVPRGSYYVPLNQPLGNLVLAALEPDTQSSYFANQLLESLQSTVRVMADPSIKLEELP
ncbi:M14 family metallopeptidase [Polaromonas jejuensis]|uniref:M14 family metallopeptidase n=1 Tax=Polaromonas jejuensis TaxID=457502 RepID=A0ABW0QGJ9_9BURK|nr:M14 family metallopeptidase [Polaromonas jejuensis]